jgi:hypothetical protein
MSSYDPLGPGEPVLVDMPAAAQSVMPVRHFWLDRLDGRVATLRAKVPIESVPAGVPAALTVGRNRVVLESVIVSATPPDTLTVVLADGPERRAYPRVPLVLKVQLEILSSPGSPVFAVTSNVSLGGLMARTEHPVRVGERSFVAIGDAPDQVMALARVLECYIEPSELYVIRLQFTLLSRGHEQRLAGWIDRAIGGSAS